MKIVKFIASFLLFLGILVLMVWAGVKSKDQTCTDISILINSTEEPQLLTKSDILHILKQNNVQWKEKAIKEIDLSFIHKILAEENYIKSVDKVLFFGKKLQIEITLYDILLEVQPKNGNKFLLDVNGTCLPYSPKVGNSVIIAQGTIPCNYQKKVTITPDNHELYELFVIASLIHEDLYYNELFRELHINDNKDITLIPFIENIPVLPVLFGTTQDAPHKLKSLKYMYKDVLPYVNEDKYARLDVRFKNRIIATKSKT
jgi:hypothetical protein